MNRRALVDFSHNAKSFLTVSNSAYKQWVFRYTFLELENDLGIAGDITTNSIFKVRQNAVGEVLAKENGIVAGLEEIKYFLVDADSGFRSRLEGRFEVEFKVKDGEKVSDGDVIMVVKADFHDLLAVERVVLNLVGRMSGVASFASGVVESVEDFDVLITPTRKTLWGLLDKKSVVVGGGGTHRLNLSDAVLVKDNHLVFLDGDFDLLFKRLAIMEPECRFVEVEVDSKEDALKCAKVFSANNLSSVVTIMLDNFGVKDVMETLDEMKTKKYYDNFLFESSGGINEGNVVEYAKTGVDIISLGCLTQGVRSLDVGMEVV